MKVEKIHDFALNNDESFKVKKEENHENQNFHKSNETFIQNNYFQNNFEQPFLNFSIERNVQDISTNPAFKYFCDRRFLDYLQSSFNYNDIYNLFKSSVFEK